MARPSDWLLVCLVPCFAGCAMYTPSPENVRYETIKADTRHDTAAAIKHNEKGLTWLECSHPVQAEKHFNKAIIADIDYAPAHNNLGQLYFSTGRLYLAAWEFEYAAKLMNDRPEPHYNLGLIYEETGRNFEALQEYQSALDRDHKFVQALSNMTRIRIRQGERNLETAQMLQDIVVQDDRPEWRGWAKEQLETTHQDLLNNWCEVDQTRHEISLPAKSDPTDQIPPEPIPIEEQGPRQGPDITPPDSIRPPPPLPQESRRQSNSNQLKQASMRLPIQKTLLPAKGESG